MDTAAELVEAFSAAVPFALREMAAVEAVVRETRPATAADGRADVSATIRLTAPRGEERLILNFPDHTAAALARRVLADTMDEPGAEMVRDCAGEVANVAAGQAKALLVGSPAHFTISTPTVRVGEPVDVPAGAWTVVFDSGAGGFAAIVVPAGSE